MREKIIEYVKPKNTNFMDSKEAFIMVFCMQTFYPLPFLFVIFWGDRFTKICLIYCLINSVVAIITAIVFRNIKKMNNTYAYFTITCLGIGINFLVLVLAIYKFIYKSFIPCLISIGFAVCMIVLFIIFIKKYIKKEKRFLHKKLFSAEVHWYIR